MTARHIFYDNYGYLRIGWMILLIGVVGTGLIAGLIFGGVYSFDRPICREKAEAIDVDWQWGFWAGCIVSVDGARWFPLDQYRAEVDR